MIDLPWAGEPVLNVPDEWIPHIEEMHPKLLAYFPDYELYEVSELNGSLIYRTSLPEDESDRGHFLDQIRWCELAIHNSE